VEHMTPAIEVQHIDDDGRGRAFYSIRTPSLAAWPASVRLASRYFVCLVVADGTTETTEEVGQWAELALQQGLVYACSWGPGCEVVEDMVDWAFIGLTDHEARPIVITTSHPDESVESALEFFVDEAKPDGAYLRECSSWLLVEVGLAGARSGARDRLVSMVSALR
jgi:hypothetical protein